MDSSVNRITSVAIYAHVSTRHYGGKRMKLTKKRRLPADTQGERVLTPYGEIHIEARTLGLWRDLEQPGTRVTPHIVARISGALMYDITAGFISTGLADEINRRLARVLRGKSARKSNGGK